MPDVLDAADLNLSNKTWKVGNQTYTYKNGDNGTNASYTASSQSTQSLNTEAFNHADKTTVFVQANKGTDATAMAGYTASTTAKNGVMGLGSTDVNTINIGTSDAMHSIRSRMVINYGDYGVSNNEYTAAYNQYTYWYISSNATAGGVGGAGIKGQDGQNGQELKITSHALSGDINDNTKNITANITAQAGGNGGKGSNGATGGNGGKSADIAPATISGQAFHTFSGRGGDGGTGGAGGAGGAAGKGGSVTANLYDLKSFNFVANDITATIKGGDGGDGGQGGSGGKGGNGGNSGNVKPTSGITVDPNSFASYVIGAGGTGGKGGAGGAGGAAGKGGSAALTAFQMAGGSSLTLNALNITASGGSKGNNGTVGTGGGGGTGGKKGTMTPGDGNIRHNANNTFSVVVKDGSTGATGAAGAAGATATNGDATAKAIEITAGKTTISVATINATANNAVNAVATGIDNKGDGITFAKNLAVTASSVGSAKTESNSYTESKSTNNIITKDVTTLTFTTENTLNGGTKTTGDGMKIASGSVFDFNYGSDDAEKTANRNAFTEFKTDKLTVNGGGEATFKIANDIMSGNGDKITITDSTNGKIKLVLNELTIKEKLESASMADKKGLKDAAKQSTIIDAKGLSDANLTVKFDGSAGGDGTGERDQMKYQFDDFDATDITKNARYDFTLSNNKSVDGTGKLTSTLQTTMDHSKEGGDTPATKGSDGANSTATTRPTDDSLDGKAGGTGSDAHMFGNGGDGADGGKGGNHTVSDFNGNTASTGNITAKAEGGKGGDGGAGGRADGIDHQYAREVGLNTGDGGNGGDGGDAVVKAVDINNASTNKTITITGSTITAEATGGKAGSGGSAGDSTKGENGNEFNRIAGGTDGTINKGNDGQNGAGGKAEAYGIYTDGSAPTIINQSGAGTLTINAKADPSTGDTPHSGNKAHSIYGDNLTINLDGSIDAKSEKNGGGSGDGVYLKDSTINFNDANKSGTFTADTIRAENTTFNVNVDRVAGTANKVVLTNGLSDDTAAESLTLKLNVSETGDKKDIVVFESNKSGDADKVKIANLPAGTYTSSTAGDTTGDLNNGTNNRQYSGWDYFKEDKTIKVSSVDNGTSSNGQKGSDADGHDKVTDMSDLDDGTGGGGSGGGGGTPGGTDPGAGGGGGTPGGGGTGGTDYTSKDGNDGSSAVEVKGGLGHGGDGGNGAKGQDIDITKTSDTDSPILLVDDLAFKIKAGDGGAGGKGGNADGIDDPWAAAGNKLKVGNGGKGGDGGDVTFKALKVANSDALIASSLDITATAGDGGAGGEGGDKDKGANLAATGDNIVDGWSLSSTTLKKGDGSIKSKTELQTEIAGWLNDRVDQTTGIKGDDGKTGVAIVKAIEVSDATINLGNKDNPTNIKVKAVGNTGSQAYSIDANNANLLILGDTDLKATADINSGGETLSEGLVINNSTIDFSKTTPSVLKAALLGAPALSFKTLTTDKFAPIGTNTLVFNTDLANNTGDKMVVSDSADFANLTMLNIKIARDAILDSVDSLVPNSKDTKAFSGSITLLDLPDGTTGLEGKITNLNASWSNIDYAGAVVPMQYRTDISINGDGDLALNGIEVYNPTTPAPQPQPTPEPEPDPEPSVDPEPEPEPTPDPTPQPQPAPLTPTNIAQVMIDSSMLNSRANFLSNTQMSGHFKGFGGMFAKNGDSSANGSNGASGDGDSETRSNSDDDELKFSWWAQDFATQMRLKSDYSGNIRSYFNDVKVGFDVINGERNFMQSFYAGHSNMNTKIDEAGSSRFRGLKLGYYGAWVAENGLYVEGGANITTLQNRLKGYVYGTAEEDRATTKNMAFGGFVGAGKTFELPAGILLDIGAKISLDRYTADTYTTTSGITATNPASTEYGASLNAIIGKYFTKNSLGYLKAEGGKIFANQKEYKTLIDANGRAYSFKNPNSDLDYSNLSLGFKYSPVPKLEFSAEAGAMFMSGAKKPSPGGRLEARYSF